MCKRKVYQMDIPVMATEGVYEGQTVRLDTNNTVYSERSVDRADHTRGRFPWWMFWLIWPLIGLVKWFVPLYLGAAAAIFAQFSVASAAPFAATVLIITGLVLIGRR